MSDSPSTRLSDQPSDLTSGPVAAATPSAPPERRPSPGLIFFVAALALFVSTVDLTIVATALPAIHQSLHATINWAGWTITIYGLGVVVVLPIAGKLSDQSGRRRVLLISVAIFAAASLVCGFATDIYMLIVFRALQAFGGGALMPSAAGLVADHFGKNRDRAIGLFGSVGASGQVAGPVLGGLFVAYLSWRWVFFINVPISAVLFVLTAKYIPESRRQTATRTDIRGLVLMTSFVLAAIFGITALGDSGTSFYDPIFLVPELAALALLCAFARHTRRSPAPFIPLRLIAAPSFAAMNVLNMFYGVVGFGLITLVPLYAEQRYHLHVLNAGSLLTARAVGMFAISSIAAFTLRRTGFRRPMYYGFAFIALGIFVLSISPRWGISPYVWLSTGAGITGLGAGSINPAARNACLHLAPNDVAVITGLRNMFTYIGIIFSVSIITAILNRSPDPGTAQSHILWVMVGIIFFVVYPLVRRVPEFKGTW